MKKIAMSPSTVMGFAYLQAMTSPKGKPYIVGDIGDFINWCVKFALKFGLGLEFAIISGKPTIMDLHNKAMEQ